MNQSVRFVTLLLLFSLLTRASAACASDYDFHEVFRDTLYGGAVGTLIGGALLAFTKKPADNLDYLGYGAAVGILTGSAYGLARSAYSLAEIYNGKIKISLPTVIPALVVSPATGQTAICWTANLVRGTFD